MIINPNSFRHESLNNGGKIDDDVVVGKIDSGIMGEKIDDSVVALEFFASWVVVLKSVVEIFGAILTLKATERETTPGS